MAEIINIVPRLIEHHARQSEFYTDCLETSQQMLARLSLQAMGQEPLTGWIEPDHAV